jgi:regulatory protein
MPFISAIEVQAHHPRRRSLFIDGSFFAGVDQEVIARLHLTAGQEVQDGDLQRALDTEEEIRIRESCLRYLDQRAMTRYELKQRLQRKGYEINRINAVLDALEASQIIDDKHFAKLWMEEQQNHGTLSKRKLEMVLRQKGITPEIITEQSINLTTQSEVDACWALATRRVQKLKSLTPLAARQRLAGYLLRQGFDSAMVWEIVKKIVPAASQETDE